MTDLRGHKGWEDVSQIVHHAWVAVQRNKGFLEQKQRGIQKREVELVTLTAAARRIKNRGQSETGRS